MKGCSLTSIFGNSSCLMNSGAFFFFPALKGIRNQPPPLPFPAALPVALEASSFTILK